MINLLAATLDSDHGLGDSLATHWAINQRKSRD